MTWPITAQERLLWWWVRVEGLTIASRTDIECGDLRGYINHRSGRENRDAQVPDVHVQQASFLFPLIVLAPLQILYTHIYIALLKFLFICIQYAVPHHPSLCPSGTFICFAFLHGRAWKQRVQPQRRTMHRRNHWLSYCFHSGMADFHRSIRLFAFAANPP